jgi:hypothetical protein
MAKSVRCLCAFCGKYFLKNTGYYNRAIKISAPLYCDIKCAGLARRNGKTEAQKKQEKRLYDMNYREKNQAIIKSKKADYFQATYDPEKAAQKRKENMHRHVEYCRRPEYVEWKRCYDEARRAKKNFGDFAEAYLALRDIESEVESRATKYEIGLINGTINKAQNRRRNHERSVGN